MRKRMILAIVLVLTLIVSAVPAMAAGSVSASLSVDSSSISAGSTVTVTVYAEVDSCGSGGISISYDSSVFELTGGSCTLSGTDLSYFDASTKDGAFAYANNQAISGSAFQFTLKAKNAPSSGSSTTRVNLPLSPARPTDSVCIAPRLSGASATSVALALVVPVIVISAVLVSAGISAARRTLRMGSVTDWVIARSEIWLRKRFSSRLPKRPVSRCQSRTTYRPFFTVM